MFSLPNMPLTASTIFSAHASLTAFTMLIRSVTNDFIPHEFQSYLYSVFHSFFTPLNTNLTLVFDEQCGMTNNEVYEAAQIYLSTKVSPKTERLQVSKTPRQKHFSISLEKGEEVSDIFGDINLMWRFVCVEPQGGGEHRSFELSFNKKFKEKVFDCYLPHVLSKAKEIKQEEKVIKLYNRDCPCNYEDGDCGDWGSINLEHPYCGDWGSINLEHPSNFDTLAMDAGLKKMIVEDLDRFLERREFYKKVGKAWKRGYLLYGPPGTGKSSLIAAMANYLKFDVYDLELTSIYNNSDLRRVLLSTKNRSILVIEDIDCSVEMHDRENRNESGVSNNKLTLSGLLNFIDGLWSSCGDERIIVFTTNHKDRLDPALLRPGRMDVHINMSYCTPDGFKILASNYLGDSSKCHPLFGEIEGLMETGGVTPAEVAEELMKGDDADVVLEGLVSFLKRKKIERNNTIDVHEAKRRKTDADDDDNNKQKVVRKNRRRGGKNQRC